MATTRASGTTRATGKGCWTCSKAHAAELRAWASDAGVRLPSAESAGELREQVRDLPQEPQIQEQPGYGYQPGFQQPQQWQQQPWN